MNKNPRTAVVVIDDEPAIVDVVCDVLQDEGFATVGCQHGREAFSCILQSRPDLVILDIQMPDVDGIQVFHQMRTEPKTAHTPVIFFTANSHLVEQRLPNYHELGAELLPKPFNVDNLLDLVSKSLSSDS